MKHYGELSIKQMAALGGCGLLVFLGSICGLRSYKTIEPGTVGLVTRFGGLTGSVLTEGFNLKLPIDSVDIMDVKINQHSGLGMHASSKDMQIVTTSVLVNYKLNIERIIDIRRHIGKDEKVIEEGVLQPQLNESVKAVCAKYKADQLLAQRAKVREEMNEAFQAKLDGILKGAFVVVEFAITDFTFSNAFNQAIEAKVEAEQTALRKVNELEQSKADAEKKMAVARGEAESAKITAAANAEVIKMRAKAEADALSIQNQVLKSNLEWLEMERLRRWDGKLPLVVGSDKVFMDIGKLGGGK
jgi:regulator of protease activity HflC (stomatin/prohibitin superfamily)